MTVLAVFKSRAQALDCVSILRGAGVPAQPVSTPSEARAGCGISVKFEGNFLARVRPLVERRAYTSFAGFMRGGSQGFFYI